jgi:beta-lactamase class A
VNTADNAGSRAVALSKEDGKRGRNAAAGLLLAALRARAGIRYARSLGDRVTRLDRTGPAVIQARPGDDRDTTPPRATGLT